MVFNAKAGRTSGVDPYALGDKYLGKDYLVVCPEQLGCYAPTPRVLVVGGDGTLKSVLSWCHHLPVRVLYLPLGTLNERGKQAVDGTVGLAGEEVFTYVAATGIFCPLGWSAPASSKQRFHRLAYLVRVWREYRISNIPLSVAADGERYRGTYTLAMLIRSKTCFGLSFNRAYRPQEEGGHLLLLPSPGRDSVFNRARLFFPLFRVFFVGMDKDVEGKRYLWRAVKEVRIEGPSRAWCLDGERRELSSLDVRWRKMEARLEVICPPRLGSPIDKSRAR